MSKFDHNYVSYNRTFRRHLSCLVFYASSDYYRLHTACLSLNQKELLLCFLQRWRICSADSWSWRCRGPGGSWGGMEQPGGHKSWGTTSNKMGRLCELGTLQVGDSLQQWYPPASALFPSWTGKITPEEKKNNSPLRPVLNICNLSSWTQSGTVVYKRSLDTNQLQHCNVALAQKECQSVSRFSHFTSWRSAAYFPRLRDHYYHRLKPEPLKAVADKYLWAALRVCNLLKHADRVMSHVAVTPGGGRISINPNRPSLTPDPSPVTGLFSSHYMSLQGFRNSSNQGWFSSIHVCLNISGRAINSMHNNKNTTNGSTIPYTEKNGQVLMYHLSYVYPHHNWRQRNSTVNFLLLFSFFHSSLCPSYV